MKSTIRLLFVTATVAIVVVSIPSVSFSGDETMTVLTADDFVAVDVMPEMVFEQLPVYPEKAKAKEVEGTVWIQALVGEDGTVSEAKVKKTSGVTMLDESALKAAYICRYKPAEQRGKPVEVWVTYKVVFDLDGSTRSGEDLSVDKPSADDFVAVEVFPEMIHEEAPVYPEEAEKEKLEGVVWVKARVDEQGNVTKTMISRTSGHKCFDKAALEAAYKCRYKPALAKGKPVSTWVTYKVDFNLSEK